MISKRGATSVTATVFIQDTSSGTGAGLTGLTSSSGGLAAGYRAQGHAGGFTTFALSAGTSGTWSSGGFVEIDSVHAPGLYEIGLPNAALASGNFVDLYMSGANNMAPTPLKIDLVAYDPQDPVHLGLSALPNASAGAAGGLPLGDASGGVTVAGYETGHDPATLVWGALTASFDTASTFGAYVQSISGGGGGMTLDSLLAGHTTAGTVGLVLNHLSGLSIDGSGDVTYNNAAPPSAASIATATAAAILSNPAHLLATDASGGVSVAGYEAGQDPGTYVLVTPTHKLATDGSGDVTYNNAAPPSAASIATATAAAILVNPTHLLATDGSGDVTYNNAAPPTASAIATAVATLVVPEILATPGHPIANDANGFVTYNNTAPPSAGTIATAAAAAILVNPAHLLATDVSGGVTVAGYEANQDPGTYVLATPSHKLATDGSGDVTYNNTAPPSAASIATATAAAILVNPTHLLATDSSGDVTYNNAAPPTAAAISAVVTPAVTTAVVDGILADPSYPIVTNASGQVTYSNAAPPTLTAIEAGVAAAILKTPSQPIATDASGDVTLSSATVTALLNGITTEAIAGGVLDQNNGIEVGLTVRQALRLCAAAAVGTRSGVGTGTVVIDGAGTETTRITATMDTNGNISATNLVPG